MKLRKILINIILTIIFLLSLTSFTSRNVFAGLMNPAAVYCYALNYTYDATTSSCILPNHKAVSGWAFLEGRVAQSFSYCKIKGYKMRTVRNSSLCSRIFSSECTVCVLPNGSEEEATKLMNLSFSNTYCGDGVCDVGENYTNCPEDCPQPIEVVQVNSSQNRVTNSTVIDSLKSKCGNGICDDGETYKTCPQDCPSGSLDGYCDRVKDGRCDPDCKNGEDPDCPRILTSRESKESKKSIALFIISIIAIGIIFIVLTVSIIKRKPKKILEERVKEVHNYQEQSNQTLNKESILEDPFKKYKDEFKRY